MPAATSTDETSVMLDMPPPFSDLCSISMPQAEDSAPVSETAAGPLLWRVK
ncbi:MAG: hypothetical protein WDM89_00955 [Rhizomicrobium sp.]